MPDSAGAAGRLLRHVGRVDDDQAAGVDPLAAGRQAPLLAVEVAGQLSRVVPNGWEVSTGVAWSPAGAGAVLLHPGVVVHRSPGVDGALPVPPALCVSVAAARLDHRSARVYARSGVDHYWHLDSRSGALEVLVRVDDEFRHAETLTIPTGTGTGTGSGDDAAEWVDFGIGVVRLALHQGTAAYGVPLGA